MRATRLSACEREALELLAELDQGYRARNFTAIRDALEGLDGVQLHTADPILKASVRTVLQSWNHEITAFQIAA